MPFRAVAVRQAPFLSLHDAVAGAADAAEREGYEFVNMQWVPLANSEPQLGGAVAGEMVMLFRARPKKELPQQTTEYFSGSSHVRG